MEANAHVVPIGLCESCGRSRIIWEVELVPDTPGGDDPLEAYKVCWDCIEPTVGKVVKSPHGAVEADQGGAA